MNYVTFIYRWWNRDLRRIINSLLRSWVAREIQKMNYIQNFCLKEKNVEKTEVKLLFVLTDNWEKLLDFVLKNFPEIEKISVN